MKNSTLLFRSLGIVILLAGTAHLFTFAANKGDFNNKDNAVVMSENDLTSDSLANTALRESTAGKAIKPKQQNGTNYKQATDYIIDKWKVTYSSEEYKGSIIYEIKKVGKIFEAYTYQYEDENGYSQKAEGAKTLTIESFDGYKGKGIYKIEYEGEKYDIACQIDMVDENTFKLSYDYYGYSDVETWKRQ